MLLPTKELNNEAVTDVVPWPLGGTCFNHLIIYYLLLIPQIMSCRHVDPLSCLKGHLTVVKQKDSKQNYIPSCPCCLKNLFENSINRTLLILLHQMWFGSLWQQAQQISLSTFLSSLHVKFPAEPSKPGWGEEIWELLQSEFWSSSKDRMSTDTSPAKEDSAIHNLRLGPRNTEVV